jgi:hypothetical protein
LNFFYFKQTLNEVITNAYYLLGCLIYQTYLVVNNSFTTNYERTVNLNSTPKTSNVTLSSGNSVLPTTTKSANQNLFFLQKTMSTLSNFTDTTELKSTKSASLQTLNTSFRNSVYFNTLASSSAQPTTYSTSLSEANYVLGSQLNPAFTQTLNTNLTLNELYNDSSFTNDPMLAEVLPTNLNNIAKQQR